MRFATSIGNQILLLILMLIVFTLLFLTFLFDDTFIILSLILYSISCRKKERDETLPKEISVFFGGQILCSALIVILFITVIALFLLIVNNVMAWFGSSPIDNLMMLLPGYSNHSFLFWLIDSLFTTRDIYVYTIYCTTDS